MEHIEIEETQTEHVTSHVLLPEQIKSQSFRIKLTRNGTVYDLGLVSYYHKNKLLTKLVGWYIHVKLRYMLNMIHRLESKKESRET